MSSKVFGIINYCIFDVECQLFYKLNPREEREGKGELREREG
jgi:hypothetical protein